MECFEMYPYWRAPYAPEVSSLLEDIPTYLQLAKQFIKDPQNADFLKGYIREYRNAYILECNRGEKTGTQTLCDTDCALNTLSPGGRNFKKTRNLGEAVEYVFGSNLFVENLQHKFTPTLAKNVNKIIGDGLFVNAGQYRRKEAKPSGYDYFYLAASTIEVEIDNLFREINDDVGNDELSWYSIASKFLERFLLIHPFPNGNGRTARILVSALLCAYTLVPVSLFNPPSFDRISNEVYLNCINEAHVYKNFQLLNSLIIESAFRSLDLFLSSLDLYVG